MKHIVMFSGGLGSWGAARRVIDAVGVRDTLLLFADVKMEDADLYRFLGEAAFGLGVEIVTIADGRTPWQVFRDERYLGNSRIDPCSKILKRQLMRKWVNENYGPEQAVVYLGIGWHEIHRQKKIAGRWRPYHVEFPMCEAPFLSPAEIIADLETFFIKPPRLYAQGFPHNNCGGFCVKAGQAQFALLHHTNPKLYAYHEAQEQELRAYLGKDVSIMKDRRGGKPKPLTMTAFRERIEAGEKTDKHDWGGCGCAVD